MPNSPGKTPPAMVDFLEFLKNRSETMRDNQLKLAHLYFSQPTLSGKSWLLHRLLLFEGPGVLAPDEPCRTRKRKPQNGPLERVVRLRGGI